MNEWSRCGVRGTTRMPRGRWPGLVAFGGSAMIVGSMAWAQPAPAQPVQVQSASPSSSAPPQPPVESIPSLQPTTPEPSGALRPSFAPSPRAGERPAGEAMGGQRQPVRQETTSGPNVVPAQQTLPTDTAPAETFPRLESHADLHNFFLYRNDSDVDRTRPFYDKNGQSVGAFATLLRPKITWHIHQHLRIYYEAELGLNYWSKNNPDVQDAIAPDVFVLKHREVYSEGEFLRGTTGFKAGYQYFRDTTGMFVGHWIGAATAWWAWQPGSKLSAFLGQIPDQTYEGINVIDNNFRRDIFVFGPRMDINFSRDDKFAAAVHTLYDTHVVDKTRYVVAPNMQLEGKRGDYSGFLGAVVQFGRIQRAALGGADQNIFAWAVQAHGAMQADPVNLAVNVLALSPDDQSEGNTRNGAFLYSSKSRSATIILTEDEIRNWYDQWDRRLGRYEGGFWTHRAGLLVADMKATWMATPIFRPALVVGAGSVLNQKNAMGNSLVGVESDLNLEFRASDNLVGNLVGGILLPGHAAGALLNKTVLQSADPIWMLEAAMTTRY